MKRAVVGMIAAVVLFFCMSGIAGAAETSGKMKKAVDKQLEQQNYDYDKGSLKLEHVETKNLSQSLNNTSKLKMAIANYKTVRQDIFFTTHKEIFYFDPEAGEIIPQATAAKADEVQAYTDKVENLTGENMHIAVILGLLFVFLLICAYFIFIWAKQQYSVLSYQLENNLFEGTGDPKYK